MQPEIDPSTGDYTGQRITSLANAVWLRIKTPVGSWWAEKTIGSRLHTLPEYKALPYVTKVAEGMALEALKPLLDSGRASSITAFSTLVGSVLLLVVTTVDATGVREEHQFSQVL